MEFVISMIMVLPELNKSIVDCFLSVFAISQLHASLGLPLLPGWIPGGDPCGPPSWQGVECVNANITAL